MKMVSVIIPTYNREETLLGSINSVLNQTYTDLELIIVDDCSADNTRKLVNSIDDPRLNYICFDNNQGACAARNAGINIANGEYIAFQDSDDYWYPEKLDSVLKMMEGQNADVCFHKMKRIYPDNRKTDYFPNLNNSGFISHEKMICTTLISTQTIVAKSEVFKKHSFDKKVKKAQDYDWAIRASREYSFYYYDAVLVDQYIQNDSISMFGRKIVKETREYFLMKYPLECKETPAFEIFQLRKIARCKVFLDEDASAEFERIYQLTHSIRDYCLLVLCKAKLLKISYMIKGHKKERIEN